MPLPTTIAWFTCPTCEENWNDFGVNINERRICPGADCDAVVSPHTTRHKAFGYFYCLDCGKQWKSGDTSANVPQMCNRCRVQVLPYNLEPLNLCGIANEETIRTYSCYEEMASNWATVISESTILGWLVITIPIFILYIFIPWWLFIMMIISLGLIIFLFIVQPKKPRWLVRGLKCVIIWTIIRISIETKKHPNLSRMTVGTMMIILLMFLFF